MEMEMIRWKPFLSDWIWAQRVWQKESGPSILPMKLSNVRSSMWSFQLLQRCLVNCGQQPMSNSVMRVLEGVVIPTHSSQ